VIPQRVGVEFREPRTKLREFHFGKVLDFFVPVVRLCSWRPPGFGASHSSNAVGRWYFEKPDDPFSLISWIKIQ
jgi:hypothetical protein